MSERKDINVPSINLIDFSFLNHKPALTAQLQARTRNHLNIVENIPDFWQFVNKYESMLRNMGQPILPPVLSKSERKDPKIYHKVKHLTMELDEDALQKLNSNDTMGPHIISQFRQMILIYLDFKQKEKFKRIKKLHQSQQALPIARFKDDMRAALDASRVLIIAGDTGCGKSTQVPQYLLEFGYRSVACTQPRRLACVSLSKRVAHELLDDYGSKVGFQIRFERNRTQRTNILFITEGLLLRQLAVAANLDQYDAIILDEIHERNLFGDFLLGIMKCLLRAKPELKLILMSATINVELFHNYFKDEGARLLQVPGRLYPIKLRYMPPPALELKAGQATRKRADRTNARMDPAPFVQVLSLIDQQYPISERGDVLIFVSGVNEITSVCDAIVEYANQQAHWLVLPLHSGLALTEQDKVFDYAPDGTRKCIVSTNIAETSLTVDGVRFVVDSGKVKEMSYDATCKGQRLKEFWVSKSSAEQRKGRAGRTGPGVCFRLYTQQQFDAFEAYPAPEILRVPLETILLQMVSMGLPDVRVFPFIQSPDSESLEQSILALKQHNAFSVDEKITPLGSALANLPVELTLGKMLLMGSVFANVEQLLTLSALLSVQNPFTHRAYTDQRCERERQHLETDQGDLFTLLNAYHEWLTLKLSRDDTRKWCHRLGIEEQRFYEVGKLRHQFRTILESCRMANTSGNRAELSSSERARRHGELRQLKALKRKQKFEQPRQRKLLKQHRRTANNDDDIIDDYDKGEQDMRDVDFRLRHDSRQMQTLARSANIQQHSEVVLMKLLFVSGFYPQLSIADEFNYCKGGTQQFFHTKLKPFLSMHPNTYWAKSYEILKLPDSELYEKPNYYTPKQPLSARHQLLCYQSLLETAKPYLMNCIRLPAAQTLLLFSYDIDTNVNVSRVVCDSWLCVDFPLIDSGMEILNRAINLRQRWNTQLYDKLNKDDDFRPDNDLWHDLVDYMSLEAVCGIKRLLPADQKVLYTRQPLALKKPLTKNPFTIDYPIKENVEKGGIDVSEHVTYGCLAEVKWTLAMQEELQALGWQCPQCDYTVATTKHVDMLTKLLHRQKCSGRKLKKEEQEIEASSSRQSTTTTTTTTTTSKRNASTHHCNVCGRDLQLSHIDMLRHRRQCVKTSDRSVGNVD